MEALRLSWPCSLLHSTGELFVRVNHLVRWWAADGIGGPRAGERVGCLAPNVHQVLETHFAVAAVRGVVVNLNTRLAPPEMAYVLQVPCEKACPRHARSIHRCSGMGHMAWGTQPDALREGGREGGRRGGVEALRSVHAERFNAPLPNPPTILRPLIAAPRLPIHHRPPQTSRPAWVVASRRHAALLCEALRLASLRLRGVLWIDDVGTAAAGRRRRQREPQAEVSVAAATARDFDAITVATATTATAFRPPPVEASAAYEMYFTSGTTGRPKGVVLSHQNVVLHALGCMLEHRIHGSDVWAHIAPMFHLVDARALCCSVC